jgi:signal peptidase II
LILLGGGTVLVDRTAKVVALRSLAPIDGAAGRRRGVLQLVTNQRPLFARAGSGWVLVAVWVLAVTCALPALWADQGLGSYASGRIGLAVALGGAAGNLLDRLTWGGVVDFITIGWWPAFNLADVAIVAGAAIAVGSLI